MPVCRCHSFDSLEAQTAPILSHADISNLVTISALEPIPMGIRTEAEGRLVHERIMKLQEDFLRVIAERPRSTNGTCGLNGKAPSDNCKSSNDVMLAEMILTMMTIRYRSSSLTTRKRQTVGTISTQLYAIGFCRLSLRETCLT